MEKVCARCRQKKEITGIDVRIRINHLTYSTSVATLTCPACLGKRVDPNELAAFKVGIAMRRVEGGRLTGISFGYCRKALRLALADVAQDLALSAESLLALEDKRFPVPFRMSDYMARLVREAFAALAFLPSLNLEESHRYSAKHLEG